ncbi:MAG: ASKHA domain-containing protein [Desulfobacteraceae bacterium]|nr:ASKHA domain-containing protein [Desulfobacteraceae bacterium]
MSEVTVKFNPEATSAEAQSGAKLIEVASCSGIDISNLCGGQGVCGKCRVRIDKGRVKFSNRVIGKLSQKELEQGYTLACQSELQDSDVEVWIPPESRSDSLVQISDYVIASSEYISEARTFGIQSDPPIRPLCQKFYLQLPPPTLTDSLSDLDRIYREIRRNHPEIPSAIQAHFSCLWGLGDLLRRNKWRITVTVHFQDNESPQICAIEGGNTTKRNFGVAIDVGTTTIVVQLVDLRTGAILGAQASSNSQARYGEDVISRMIYACTHGGLAPLNDAVLHTINALIDSLVRKNRIRQQDITALVAAGNTVMNHLLLGLEPCNIRVAPYIPTANRFPQFQAAEVGLKGHPKAVLHCMPCVSSYVGGDIAAGVLACGMHEKPEISALIDVGTNGEIVIGNNEWLVCCSSSAGPAFEGGGVKCGTRAIPGAIEKVNIERHRVTYETIGHQAPLGLCGSAIIDLISELLMDGIIDQSGKFSLLDHPRVRVIDDVPEFIVAHADETLLGEPIVITEDDVSNLIKSKGAVLAAVKLLLKTLDMGFADLEKIYVAGGFGAHLDIEKSILIGLLPDIPKERIQYVGNSSLAGARLALLSTSAFRKAESIASRMTYIELSVHPEFMNEFIASLFLPHTDMDLFPSAKAALERKRKVRPVCAFA